MIEVNGLTKVYRSGLFGKNRKTALDHVSFTLRDGETLGVIGESGCGKSTLSMLLCKLLRATEGTVVLDGQDVSSLGRRERKQGSRQKVSLLTQCPSVCYSWRITHTGRRRGL